MEVTKTSKAILKKVVADRIATYGRVRQRTVVKWQKLIFLALRDGKTCHWCHEPVFFSWDNNVEPYADNLATFDHKITQSNGGGHKPKNAVLACRECNEVRGDTEFREFTRLVNTVGMAEVKRLGQVPKAGMVNNLGMAELKRRYRQSAAAKAEARGWTRREQKLARKEAKRMRDESRSKSLAVAQEAVAT